MNWFFSVLSSSACSILGRAAAVAAAMTLLSSAASAGVHDADPYKDIYMPSSHNAHNNLRAFPGACVGEVYARGGRGGKVYHVTTLADGGEGSLRAAVEAKGPRTVVFDVAGVIDLGSPLVISESHITIAGQTSPGGICLRGSKVFVRADEVIMRFVNVMPSNPIANLREVIVQEGGWWSIVLDHCQVDAGGSYALDADLQRERMDSDGDGIPDSFELRYGLDPQDPWDGDRKSMASRYRYTHLEYYLHSLVQDIVRAETPARKTTIHLMGDSTMALKPSNYISQHFQETGWGMLLEGFFDGDIEVYDFARNGLSTLSFIRGGMWDCVLEELQEGDYVMMQFGHNDMKDDPARHTDAFGSYQDNLEMFCDSIRARGAHPVLLTSIARRRFEDGAFDATNLGDYPEACRQLASRLGVPCIDVHTAMCRWLEETGDLDTRKYFNICRPWRSAMAPDGKVDNTHLQPAGARKVCEIVLDGIREQIPELASHIVRRDFIVAQDGSGDFRTVQEAIDAAPDYIKQDEVRILIKPGIYREKVIIPASKEKLHLIGMDPLTTVISWDDFADRPGSTGFSMGTSATSTIYVYANDFLAENLCFENTAGEVGQACAITTDGDRQAYVNCRFVGNQDTIYTYGDDERQYFKDCWIEGTTDFIFGYGTCYFDHCTIMCKRDSYITAASTLKQREYGYVFRDCDIVHMPQATRVYLGRPWRSYARTVFINCRLDSHIRPEGWHNWDKPYAEKTAFYAEYGSTGPGASPRTRVGWSHQLKARDLPAYEPSRVLATGTAEDKHGKQVPVGWYFKVF